MPHGDLGKNSSGLEPRAKFGGKFVSGSPETFCAVNVSAHAPYEKVRLDGPCNEHGKWIEAHWRHQHRVPGHNNRNGEWIP